MHGNHQLSVRWVYVCLMWLVPATCFSQSVEPPRAEDWTAEESMLLYFEAISQIRNKGLRQLTTREIVRQTLRDFLRGFDPFSDYLSPEEYKRFRQAQQQHYAGVGMELQHDDAGRIVCIPYAHGPAMRAGIAAGDILEAINGRSVLGQSLLAVSAQIRGDKGTEVRLTVATKAGERRDLVIERAEIQVYTVRVERREPLPVVRIRTFNKGTAHELQETLARFAEAPALILDLRGNPGGALYSAIDAAKLFLTPGQKIVGIQTRDDLEVHRKDLASEHLTVPLYLWQDAHTASAAEVFIAALVQNKRAVSIGKKTFGKGTVQDIIELTDGSALYLTTGMLQTPTGALYHEKGLEPTYPLEAPAARSEDYLAMVTKLRLKDRTDTLKMEMTISDRASAPAGPPALRRYLLCFDKDFETRQDAEIWASEVHLSLSEKFDHYQLQRKKPDGIHYLACLGVYESEEMAYKKRRELANAMQHKVFIKIIE
jgi:carboxyl-terminal processing protease